MRLPFQRASLAAVVAACLLATAEPDYALGSTRTHQTTRAMANRRGRPRKFNRPARAVTLTLPEDTIATLKLIDRDISRAVVRAIEPMAVEQARPPAELSTFGDRAVIFVTPTRTLKERTGAEFIPVPDGRALVALGCGLTPSQFELRLRDALSDQALSTDDRDVFESLVEILQSTRLRNGSGIHERSIMLLET